MMFLFIMYKMSSGLVLYWFISNLWQIGSQLIINRLVKKEDDKKESSSIPVAQPAAAEHKPPRRQSKRRRH